MGHLSFTEILDTSLKVSWQEPVEKNGIITGKYQQAATYEKMGRGIGEKERNSLHCSDQYGQLLSRASGGEFKLAATTI